MSTAVIQKMNVTIHVNGEAKSANVEPRTLLVHFLRDELELTGTHVGCDTSQCGSCTVHLDGNAVKSCTLFAVQAEGRQVTTIEGLGKDDPVQKAWIDIQVPQCGFCQPGQIMSAKGLLAENPKPDDAAIDAGMAGNLCRCGTYLRIRAAIKAASGQAA